MSERLQLFLKVLKAEIEDCLEDIEDLANLYERRHRVQDVTNYVYFENEALLSRELSGLRKVLASIDGVKINENKDVETLAATIDAMVQKEILEFEDPEAVYSIVKRKLLKVLRYSTDRSF